MRRLFYDKKERELLFFCLGVVFLWGLAAHGYAYFSDIFSHDSLNAMVADAREELWKVELGRFLVPIYRMIRGAAALPWFNGLLALIWIGLALYLQCRLLDINNRLLLVFLAGVLVTNATVIALTATYIYELDLDMFAMLMATVGAWLWGQGGKGQWLAPAAITASMALYQSYVSVTIGLMMIHSLLALFRGETASAVFLRGIRAIGLVLIGAGIYWLGTRLACILADTTLATNYNGIANLGSLTLRDLLFKIRFGYRQWLSGLLLATPVFPRKLQLVLYGLLLGLYCLQILRRMGQIGKWERLLAVCLLLLLPAGTNLAVILSRANHDLMYYGMTMVHLFGLLLLCPREPLSAPRWQRGAAYFLLVILLMGNVRTANAAYLKKDLEQQAALSQLNRVLTRIESREDYIPGETPVVFAGVSRMDPLPGFEPLSEITGLDYTNPIAYSLPTEIYHTYVTCLRYYFNDSVALADTAVWAAMEADPAVAAMPLYPQHGSIAMIHGVLVVHMG